MSTNPRPADVTVEHFDDPATAPFGAASATTVTDEEGAFGTTYADEDGAWTACAIGCADPQPPPVSNPAPLPPGPRARIARGIGEGIAAADAGAPYSAIPYARDVYPLTRAAWSLGFTARRAQLDPASRPSTLSAALDPADELSAETTPAP